MSLKIIGHRGARGLAPENTLAAIEAGIKADADQLEIDVRVTSDGVPILWHDKELNGLRIKQHTFKELKQSKADLTTLEEAIKATKQPPVRFDIKPGEPAKPIVSVLKKFLGKNREPEDFIFASFSQKTLVALHKELPQIPTMVTQRWSGVWATHRARQLKTKYICMNQHFMWWGFIKSMSSSGYKLIVYTLNDPRKAARWEKYGLYGVVTDYPDRFKK